MLRTAVKQLCGALQRPPLTADQAVQSIKATESAGAGSQIDTALADEQWIGRAVHSSDGKYLGEVAALNEDDQHEFYVEIGGFLAIGETRVSISSDEIQEVHEDRIVLRLREPEARNLPAAEGNRGEEL